MTCDPGSRVYDPIPGLWSLIPYTWLRPCLVPQTSLRGETSEGITKCPLFSQPNNFSVGFPSFRWLNKHIVNVFLNQRNNLCWFTEFHHVISLEARWPWCVWVGVWVCRGGGVWGRDAAMKRMQMKVRIKFLKKTNLGWLKLYLATRARTTGKNNRFPLLDILGY